MIRRSDNSARRGARAAQAARLLLLIGSALALSACQPSIVDPNGPIGAADMSILIDSLGIMLAIAVPTIIAIFLFAYWFRASNGRARYLPDWSYSGQVEMVVWGIPALVILLLGGVAWIGSHELDPAQPIKPGVKPLDIEVVSLDWKWLFIYPQQGIASLNRLVVPAGVPLHFALTSASVMTVFFVPNLGSMIYTMNHMSTQLNLEADRTGQFHGLAAHYSGDGFSDMHFHTDVLSPEDFARWADEAKQSGTTLDAQSYKGLLKQTTDVAPAVYRLVDANLYREIVSQQLPSGYGPDEGPSSPSVKPQSGE